MPDMKRAYSWILTLLCFSVACNKSDETMVTPVTAASGDNPLISAALNLPASPFDYVNTGLPAYFFQNAVGGAPTSVNGIDNTPPANPITNHGATLGRVLFYDKNLSVNKTISCASCHNPNFGFADTTAFSKGIYGRLTKQI